MMMMNGNGFHKHGLTEFTTIGIIHSPSGKLLTSETFQGSLNVSGTSLKRRQVWTLFTDPKNPTAFFLQNHLGNFLSADRNGKVTLVSEDEIGNEERFLIHFARGATGEIAFQSERHSFYLQWTGSEMKCFSKEPVWWGLRLAMHPQIHLKSVHRNCYVRSANKETELRAVTKMPCSSKFLIWLQQLPLPPALASSSSKEQVAQMSRVALRTQTGRYLRADGSLAATIQKATLFAVSFKPSATPTILFQSETGEYLTVAAGGILKVKMGVREPRREEFFAIETPSTQIRLWAFNQKFACNKHGLNFSTTMEETQDHKSTIFQLEYLGGGRGLDMGAIVGAAATPSAETKPEVFAFDGSEETMQFLTTGLWRLRSQDGLLWQIPPTGGAKLAPKNCDEHTAFEILYVPTYEEDKDGSPKKKPTSTCAGGVVLRTLDGNTVCAKTLGAISVSDRVVDPDDWKPVAPEVFHMVTLVNRPSIAVYSPLSCCYIAPAVGRKNSLGIARDAGFPIDAGSTHPEQLFLKHNISGTIQMFANLDGRWLVVTATSQGAIGLQPADIDPTVDEANGVVSKEDGTEFVVCLTSDRHVLFRSTLTSLQGPAPGYLCSSLQGGLRLDTSGTVNPGCIWQI